MLRRWRAHSADPGKERGDGRARGAEPACGPANIRPLIGYTDARRQQTRRESIAS